MPKRKQSPQILRQPKFLVRVVDGADEPTHLVDSFDGRHFCVKAAVASLEKQGVQGLSRVKGARGVSRPREGGFDWLFRRHKKLMQPAYGDPEDLFEVFRAWAYAQVCRRLLPVRPIALFTGPPGATKSTTASAVAQLWYGTDALCARPLRIPDSQREMLGDFVHSPVLLLDNVEQATKWLADTLCIVSSDDGVLSTRSLYSTAGQFSIVPDTFIAVTSVSVRGFLRGDLLARSLIFSLKQPDTYVPKSTWTEEVETARAQFWSEAIKALRAVIAASLGDLSRVHAFDRLQDFMWIGETICKTLGGQAGAHRFRRGMAAVALSRVALAAADPEVEMLVQIAAREGSEDTWYTASELLDACGVGHGEHGFDQTFRSVDSFGRWLSSAQSKAVGLLQIDRKLLNGRTRWRVRLPEWAEIAAKTLQEPVIEGPTNGTHAHQPTPRPAPSGTPNETAPTVLA